MELLKTIKAGKMTVQIFDSRISMGKAAGRDIADKMRELLSQKQEINMVFAAAPSQNETLESLLSEEGIDWSRVNAFHMDEYIGLDENAPQRFGNYLREHLFSRVEFKNVYYIEDSSLESNDKKCERYKEIIANHPIDITVLGIGENAHIAFNDPWVAEFDDEKVIKVVELDQTCRNQQVNDGCFKSIEDVPTHALTLTIPTLISAKYMFCSVPASSKANAVYNTVFGEVSTDIPATIMKKHEHAVLYADADSGKLLI